MQKILVIFAHWTKNCARIEMKNSRKYEIKIVLLKVEISFINTVKK